MVGEAYGWVNSHRSLWVGLFLAEEQLLTYFRTLAPLFRDRSIQGMCGVVLRPSLFPYSYDLHMQ